MHQEHRGHRSAPITDMLGQARIPGTFDDYDEQAALARIAGRIVWNKADTMDRRAQSIREDHDRGALKHRAGSPPPGRQTALHERAASELGSLSARVIHDRAAVASMALLVDDPAIEPDGALAFACLLYLADRHDGAAFWWRFAAGAGAATAAYCLYLHHLQRSERGSAQWWLVQATDLHRQGGAWILGEPPARTPGDTPPSRYGVVESAAPRLPWEPKPQRTLTAAAEERWHGGVSPHLTAAVRRLETDSDADYGLVPRPDPVLAAELEDCVSATA
ncbi:hypothetical protein [Streptomyces sp. NPDC051162]|uniref:hypothetical protein n=1 Tax=unclassified Streptomyces TaxID=2593676 RepID=UPI0034212B51